MAVQVLRVLPALDHVMKLETSSQGKKPLSDFKNKNLIEI
jgi:hypothetical protein